MVRIEDGWQEKRGRWKRGDEAIEGLPFLSLDWMGKLDQVKSGQVKPSQVTCSPQLGACRHCQ